MIVVLDTTIVSAVMRAEPTATRRLLALRPGDVSVPQPAFAEVQYGIARLSPSRKRAELEARFAIVRRDLTAMPWSDRVTDLFGEIKADLERRGKRCDDLDVAIAAHARAADAVLVTRNAKHFAPIRDLVIDAWL
jgi:tRNA(fMet)-specific endonuclease VapC